MNNTRALNLLCFVLRLGVGAAFIVAGALKSMDPTAFAEQIANYQLMPEFSNYLATLLPALEIIAGIAFIVLSGAYRWASALIIFGMLLAFTVALSRAWALGINLECGCFGTGSTEIGVWPILRNLSLMSAVVGSLWLELRSDANTPSGALPAQ